MDRMMGMVEQWVDGQMGGRMAVWNDGWME